MTFRIPTPNWLDVEPLDTLLSFLQRTDPDQHWEQDELTGEPKAPSDPDLERPYVWTIRPAISSAQFKTLVEASLFLQNPIYVPPVWPGAGQAILLEEVALEDGLVISGDMRGLLFTITRDAPGGGRWKFGDVSSWNNVGAVAFLDDNGDYERPTTISVDTQVVVPTTMARAHGAVIRFSSPFSGTVRRFIYLQDD
jgi:hypothetical protein